MGPVARVSVAVAVLCAPLAMHVIACGVDPFACESAVQCGDGGTCEATGFCSFPDEQCPSMRRYGQHAAARLAGTCVPTEPGTDDGSASEGVAGTTTGIGGEDTQAVTVGHESSGAVDETSGAPGTDASTGVGTTAIVDGTGEATDTGGTTGSVERVTEGLLVLYLFDEGAGTVAFDQSGVDPPVDLTLEPENGSPTWAADGLEFTGGGIARALGSATKIRTGCQATAEVSVEAWITAFEVVQEGPARLVTLSANTSVRSFTMGHTLDLVGVPAWIGRLRTSTSDPNGIPTLYAMAEVTTETTHLVFSRTADGVVNMWVDGALAMDEVRDGDFSTWPVTDQFAVGNEIDLMRPWLGVIHLVAVYDRALTLDEVGQNLAAGF